MPAPDYDVVVFGATSFVGQTLTRCLAEHFSGDAETLHWAIAGRSGAKLLEVKCSLGTAGESAPIIVADAASETQLQALCAQTRVVVSTVGPYTLYGGPLIKVCVESGTDYCDLTGETQWIKRMINTYEATAQRSEARIMHCCGFNLVPSDMGTYFLQQQVMRQWGMPVTQVELRVKALKGGASGGTVASLVNVVQEAATDPALCRELTNPYALCPRGHSFTARQRSVKGAAFDTDFGVWIAPFVMAAISERVVRRSSALSDNAYDNPSLYDEAAITGASLSDRMRAMTMVAGLATFMLGIVIKPVRIVMQRFLLPKPGEGPTPATQLASRYDLRLFGRTDQGDALRVRVIGDRGPDYGSTSKMFGQAAISLAFGHTKDGLKTGRLGGSWMPAIMSGDRFIERLTRHAGLRFERI